MALGEEIEAGRVRWRGLSFYQKFEHAVVLVLVGLIAVVVIAAVWSLQVRAVILIAMLAIVRKLIILDIGPANTGELFGLAAAILALGAVYWLVRDQDRRVRV